MQVDPRAARHEGNPEAFITACRRRRSREISNSLHLITSKIFAVRSGIKQKKGKFISSLIKHNFTQSMKIIRNIYTLRGAFVKTGDMRKMLPGRKKLRESPAGEEFKRTEKTVKKGFSHGSCNPRVYTSRFGGRITAAI
jgi:hypothetical protein